MAPPKRASFNVCFCDIDGTLVHYPEAQAKWGNAQQRLSLHTGRPLFPRHEEFMLLAGEITGPSVIPGYFMYVERVQSECLLQETGKRHKVLKLPPTTTGHQVNNLHLAACRQAHNSSEDKGTACIVMLDMLVVVLPRV